MSHRPRIAILSALVLFGCHTITEDLPPAASAPTGPTLVLPIVVTPVANPVPLNPTPAPGPTPTPATGTTPAPTPTPTPTSPRTQGCSLPAGTGSGNNCPRERPTFLADVEAAMDQLVREEPGIFDLNRTQGCGSCYYVKDVSRYAAGIQRILGQRGLCSSYDGEELAVKNVNGFNDQFDILTSGGFIRRDMGSYRSTCYPAWF
jgi:hypothetical protein